MVTLYLFAEKREMAFKSWLLGLSLHDGLRVPGLDAF
jgi:hypothetical protein